jgi:hypothetical protein
MIALVAQPYYGPEGVTGSQSVHVLVFAFSILHLCALWAICRHLRRIADVAEGKKPEPDRSAKPIDLDSGVPARQYARQTGLDEQQVIEQIRGGQLSGFVKDGQWYVDG